MKLNLGRALIGLVFLINVQCALAFLFQPGVFASGFELSGEIGDMTIRGIGLLFLMWNVPYAVAFWHPIRHRLSLYEAVAMQTIGFVGETFIFISITSEHVAARASLSRFMIFDFAGLLVLLVVVWMTGSRR